MSFSKVFEKNTEWVSAKLAVDKKYFKKLAEKQEPEILFIGCSDSRVKVGAMMGVEPGDVFIHRNIGNMVPNTDLNVMSVINYAVSHLKVKHAVVCGHYYCGGVKAAMQSEDLGILNPWLRNIRDVYRLHHIELDAIKNEDQKYRRLIELNVQEQCVNLIKTPDVQKALLEKRIKVHGWVFDLGTGKLIDLKIDFDKILKDIMQIYHLDTTSEN
ncbi:carbonic anhydrase [Lutibacter sp. TH_r2]|uniref:carbonic anhydrase n=1 Tax=Lutibacter sp. TH_r2 TaxID=3082083 RepID=UPI0029545DE2|nr:carbonic anhydrase [Lutibacter sp. TH_r2]MDV7188210.1 carbonic anhydrase [Lutibacter sp. TH_r2]